MALLDGDDAFFNADEFAEPVTFNTFGLGGGLFASDYFGGTFSSDYFGGGSAGGAVTILGVVNRQPRSRMAEDGHNLTDEIEIALRNGDAIGVTSINPGRDTITLAGRYGGSAREHVITAVLDSDAGVWLLRLR